MAGYDSEGEIYVLRLLVEIDKVESIEGSKGEKWWLEEEEGNKDKENFEIEVEKLLREKE